LFATPLYNGKAPPIWLAAHAQRMLQLTGRYADGWLPNRKLSAQEYRASLEQIYSAATTAGRSVAAFEPALMTAFALGRDRQTTLASLVKMPTSAVLAMQLPGAVWDKHGLGHPMGGTFEGFADFLPEEVTPEQIDAAQRQLTPELLEEGCLAGNLDEVAAAVRALVDAGLRHLVLWNFGPPSGAMLAGLARLALLVRRLRKIPLPRTFNEQPSRKETQA
jgi:phthiodiolone/phenolphthiodiolone dimycocerosates ketoreductase